MMSTPRGNHIRTAASECPNSDTTSLSYIPSYRAEPRADPKNLKLKHNLKFDTGTCP